jgi:hypothetical protein
VSHDCSVKNGETSVAPASPGSDFARDTRSRSPRSCAAGPRRARRRAKHRRHAAVSGTRIPPVIGPNPNGATINANELASFQEGVKRAGQLEATCDTGNDVTDDSPVPGELDPIFPQIHTNSNGLGARHKRRPVLLVPCPAGARRLRRLYRAQSRARNTATPREPAIPARAAPIWQTEHRTLF